jgi:hypothetical protein
VTEQRIHRISVTGEVGDSAGVRIFQYEGVLSNTKPVS